MPKPTLKKKSKTYSSMTKVSEAIRKVADEKRAPLGPPPNDDKVSVNGRQITLTDPKGRRAIITAKDDYQTQVILCALRYGIESINIK